jgi:putative hydrolase of the HAD superfamily
MNDQKPLLLFDLGGVLVDYSGVQDIHGVLSETLTQERLAELMRASADIWSSFEVGKLTPVEFSERFAGHWPLAVSREQFLIEFESWIRALYPGAMELLAELRPSYRLAALSNTNEIHWRRMRDVLRTGDLFERAFLSHEVGLRKPSPDVFEHVLRELDVKPDEATFFDDAEANVEAARGVGMRAFRVEGVESLRACLQENGYL